MPLGTSKVFLVTGSNTGIGFEIVKQLAQAGHTVYLAARSVEAGKKAQCVIRIPRLDVDC